MYWITTWEDLLEIEEKLGNLRIDFEDHLTDYVYNAEEFAKNDFEGLYHSKEFYEEIPFIEEMNDKINSLKSTIEECKGAIEKLEQLKKDYIEHRSH